VNFKEAITSGRPFRRPCWVEPRDKYQWVGVATERAWECIINWYDGEEDSGSCFGDLEIECSNADDYEILMLEGE